ncbi:MAG: hypothetical protein GC162_14945 [Planctomycetes bacterium]|nr:hypothetical protein [Planctomycetota bacterium]
MLSESVAQSGTALFAIAALVIFFTFFTAMCFWVARRPADQMDRSAHLPIDDAPLSNESANHE